MNFVHSLAAHSDRSGAVPVFYCATTPAATQVSFALSTKCNWVSFYSTAACYILPSSTGASFTALAIPATTTTIWGPFPNPVDLSNAHVFALQAASGATLTAYVA